MGPSENCYQHPIYHLKNELQKSNLREKNEIEGGHNMHILQILPKCTRHTNSLNVAIT